MHAVTMSERNEGVILRAISRISRLNRPAPLFESDQRMSSMKSSLALTNLSSFNVLRSVVAKNVWL